LRTWVSARKRDVCQKIMAAGGDYMLIVKDNQPGERKLAQASLLIFHDPLSRLVVSRLLHPWV
jgi:hypothetical protein